MDFEKREIQSLILRFLLEEITSVEIRQLEDWRKEDLAHEVFFQRFCHRQNVREHLQGYLEQDVERALQYNRVASVAILKDAAAKAIYGSKAATGPWRSW